jgi:hypothetical protein
MRNAWRRVRWLTVPIAVYLAVTLALPALNGAATRAEFWRHAAWVTGACGAVLGIVVLAGAFADLVRWRNR